MPVLDNITIILFPHISWQFLKIGNHKSINKGSMDFLNDNFHIFCKLHFCLHACVLLLLLRKLHWLKMNDNVKHFSVKAKLRSSFWWIRFFFQNSLEENDAMTKKFEQTIMKRSYKPACQVFHLKSKHWKSEPLGISTFLACGWTCQAFSSPIRESIFWWNLYWPYFLMHWQDCKYFDLIEIFVGEVNSCELAS